MDAGSTPAISITFSLLKRKSNQKEKNIRSGDIEYTTYFNLDLLSPSLVNYIFIAARAKTRLLNYFSLLNQKEKNIGSGDIYPRHLILQELKKKRAYCQLTKK